MKWKIHKENSEDLGFAISCFFKRAITSDEFKKWLDIVLMDTPTEELPNYFFDLIDGDVFDIFKNMSYVPHDNLSRYEEYAVEGIAYIRKVRPLIDYGGQRRNSIKILAKQSPNIGTFQEVLSFC